MCFYRVEQTIALHVKYMYCVCMHTCVLHVYYIISAQLSMTFDPFMSLSVPIPRNLRHLPVIFVPRDPSIMPIEVGV